MWRRFIIRRRSGRRKSQCLKSVSSAMAGHPKKIYTIAELGRIRPKFCGCERKELLFYYESEKREVCSRV